MLVKMQKSFTFLVIKGKGLLKFNHIINLIGNFLLEKHETEKHSSELNSDLP
jgi:hypothetical protein